jgi:hypothetical protein
MDDFQKLEQAVRTAGPDAAFEMLVAKARETGDYPAVFRARSMQARARMGLPLIETGPNPEMSPERQADYEEALRKAARETGELLLQTGEIAGAWPYFRAIGEPAPVAAAIANAAKPRNLDAVIEIAFREQVNPRRGFELILEHRGICNAITWFGGLPEGEVRAQCLELLVRSLYRELAESIRQHIAKVEGAAPASTSVAELIEGREWLFEGMNYHVDTTHIASVLRHSTDLYDEAAVRMALEMADYGTHLASMYHHRDDPPFEDCYVDHGVYLRALVGEEVDRAIEHFDRKARAAASEGMAFPTDVFLDLLIRLDRLDEAIAAAAELAPDKVLQLCQMAGNYRKLREVAMERGDLLSFAAGVIQAT